MKDVEFIEETHTYLIDGVAVPSVTQIVNWYFGTDFTGVDPEVLERAVVFGVQVHKTIENYESVGIGEHFTEVQAWLKVKEKNGLNVYKQEQIVSYEDKYAGRYDMLCIRKEDEYTPLLIDIKTTSKLNADHLALQLGLYRLALGYDTDCACLWFSKDGRCELYPINAYGKEKCLNIVEAFLEGKESPYRSEREAEIQIYTPGEIVRIRQFYDLKKEIEEIEKRGRETALQIMKERGIKTVTGLGFRMTYLEPSERVVADVGKMKEDGIFDKYSKKQTVKESVRITWK